MWKAPKNKHHFFVRKNMNKKFKTIFTFAVSSLMLFSCANAGGNVGDDNGFVSRDQVGALQGQLRIGENPDFLAVCHDGSSFDHG